MSMKANKTVIGGFVVGAVALAVIGVLVFGSGRFFSDTEKWVMYFKGSAKGLNIGSPVMLKGVKIGAVTDLILECELESGTFRTKVLAETFDNISIVGGEAALEKYTVSRGLSEATRRIQFVQMLINEKGLRAQLEVQSFVTGLLMVGLDFHPGTPINLLAKDPEYRDSEYIEIPTIPTMMEELSKTLANLPFKEIVENLNKAIEGINRLVNSKDLQSSITAAHDTLEKIKNMAADVKEKLPSLTASIEEMVKDIQKLVVDADERIVPLSTSVEETLGEARNLLSNVNGQVRPFADSLEETEKSVRTTLGQINKTLALLEEGYVSESSPMYHEIASTLKTLSDTLNSIQVLAAYLERHPESLLKGKSGN